VKQAALEKMGKAESHASAEDVATKDGLANIKNGYTAVGTALKNYCNEGGALSATQGEVFAESLLTFGGTQPSPLSDALKAVGQSQKETDTHLLSLVNLTKEKMLSQVQALNDTDIKRCRDLKAKAETARLKYDTALSDLKAQQKKSEPAKLQKAEETEQKVKAAYDQATAEFAEATRQLQERVHKELTQQLREYAEAQRAYFEKGLQFWEEATSQFESKGNRYEPPPKAAAPPKAAPPIEPPNETQVSEEFKEEKLTSDDEE